MVALLHEKPKSLLSPGISPLPRRKHTRLAVRASSAYDSEHRLTAVGTQPMKSTSRWKRGILYVLGLGIVGAGIVAAVHFSTQHVPRFYREALEDASVTVETAEEFQARTTHLLESIDESPDWTESFTEQEINSWLAFEYPQLDQDLVPPEVSEPRVRFDDGYVLTACRYEGAEFSGVLSLKISPKVTESHELALELVSVKAGLIPLPLERILREIPEESDLRDWSLELVETDDGEVLLISHELFDESAYQLTAIEVEEEQITLSGQSRREDQARLTQRPDHPASASELSN